LNTLRTLLRRAGRLCILLGFLFKLYPQQPSPKEKELDLTGFNKHLKLNTLRTLLWRAGRLFISK